MLVYEYKLDGTKQQYVAIEEAIRVVQFIRNTCLRKWMDERGVSKNDLQCFCAVLARAYSFAACLNSQARQAAADRAGGAISRFYDHCKQKKPGKKGYPQFQHDNRSVEYKTTGWKLDGDGKHITFTDGCGIGRLRLVGTRAIETFPVQQIKRVRLIRRADEYYCQFSVQAERVVEHIFTGKEVGIDVGLKAYYTDSEGRTVDNPRLYRKAEKKLKRLHRQLSRKQANALIISHDLIAFEHLKIANMVRNPYLATSINDAAWSQFRSWVCAYGAMHAIAVVKVAPHYTSQDCSACGTRIKRSLSVRTHICTSCGVVLHRDHNAAKNILDKALERTVGHTGTAERDSAHASGQGTATSCS